MWELSLDRAREDGRLEVDWLDLQARAHGSYFTSWGWVGTWLRTLPAEIAIHALRVRRDGRLVGLALLGHRATVRRKIIRSTVLLVSETGLPAYDTLTVEHNELLAEAGLEPEVAGRVVAWLCEASVPWHELRIAGVDQSRSQPYLDAASACGLKAFVEADKPYFYVDLRQVRGGGGDYLSTVSGNTRYQIRRALREYERRGEVSIRPAADVDHALELLGSLKELHQRHWVDRGERGAFGTDFALSFHDSLVRARFPHGEIQLLRVSVGDRPVGYLYNLVQGGVVSNYQSAFVYEDDPKVKPGLVSHYKAIELNLARGADCYDFLMGHQRYKSSLATDEERMIWLVLQRRLMRFELEHRLRQAWRRWTARAGG
ncbi:MAG TPA: GNAT family N-acetyltransferase [Candidatus Polarisedimenticolaceae bacterium]|nr:GNAT family N-acetyltransferase [Candidatus Polarisedimenticolaceae bacterium]